MCLAFSSCKKDELSDFYSEQDIHGVDKGGKGDGKGKNDSWNADKQIGDDPFLVGCPSLTFDVPKGQTKIPAIGFENIGINRDGQYYFLRTHGPTQLLKYYGFMQPSKQKYTKAYDNRSTYQNYKRDSYIN